MITYSQFLAQHFPGRKMQKLSVNLGLSCPNRDGTKGTGGCTYCDNRSFTPAYCIGTGSTVEEQLEAGKRFFGRKYPHMRYLAYFQSYTSTHTSDTGMLMDIFRRAVAVDGVDGVVIGTRPDCMPGPLLGRLRGELPWVMIEYGAETSHDDTLRRINRHHAWADTVDAVGRTQRAGIPVGVHLINGLPGEEEDAMLATARAVGALGVDVVKFHQLQLLKGTRLTRDVEAGLCDIMRFTPQQYARLCARCARSLPPGTAVERWVSQAPAHLLVYPKWGLKNYQFDLLVQQAMAQIDNP